MNERDRQRIDIYCEEVASQVDMNKLWPKLLENRIFNFNDCNIPTWKENFNAFETKKNIISCIKTRGPHAFKNFLTSLMQSGYGDLSTKLTELEINLNSQSQEKIASEISDTALTEYSETDSEDDDKKDSESPNSFLFEDKPLQIVVKKSTKFRDTPVKGKKDLDRYIMRSKPRGKVLIVCITEYMFLERRDSAIHDRTNLKTLFEEMGFEVFVTEEFLNGDDLRRCVRDFAKQDFRQVDSCFVIFSCHGFQAGKHWDAEIAASNHHQDYTPYERIYCSEIVEYFSSENCGALKGKPKVFIFQLCRGDKHQDAMPRFTTSESNERFAVDGAVIVAPCYQNEAAKVEETSLHRNYEDIFIVHATVPGHYSYRDAITGAWLIQVLCKVFMKEAHHKHLCELFDRVDQIIQNLRTGKNKCQTVVVSKVGFHKQCFINPGYFGNAQ